MRKTSFKRLFAGFIAVLLLLCGPAASAASDTSSDAASKIQLVAADGNVTVKDSSSNTVSLNANGETRLYSGYRIVTGADSYAWFSLDETKTVKLDASSEVEVRSRRRKLQLLLISGELYCNVSEPLKSNETYEIRTSTTITGIRGTSLGVDIGRTEEGKDTITVFHGTTEVRFTDPKSANAPSVWVSGGEFLSHDQDSAVPEKEAPAPIEEISEFFAEAMEEDGNPSPWPVKPAEDNKTEGPVPPAGNVSNLFVDGGGSEEGLPYANEGEDDPEPNQDPEQNQDPEPNQDPEQNQDPEPSPVTSETYTVTWKTQDGTVLETDTDVPSGEMPSFDGEDPTKEADAQYSYSFSGWSPTPETVVGDAIYTAVFSESLRTYTVTWTDDDGTVLKTDRDIPYGEMPSFGVDDPTKEADAQYSYSFSGWSPTPETVVGDATYTAEYSGTLRTYTITWKDSDDSPLETDVEVEYGEMPSYDGASPTKEESNNGEAYVFIGWSPELQEVTEDMTYTALYSPAYTLTLYYSYEEGIGEMSEEFLNANGFTPIDTEVGSSIIGYTKLLPKGVSYTLPDASSVHTLDGAEGYVFLGWNNPNNDNPENMPLVIGDDNTEDLVLYAQYAVDADHIGYSLEVTDGYASLWFGYYDEADGSLMTKMPVEGLSRDYWAERIGDMKLSDLSVYSNTLIQPVSMAYWFSGLPSFTKFDFINIDTSLVTDMNHLFAGSSIETLELGRFDTANVQNMTGMFDDCAALTTVFVSDSFVVSGVPEDSVLFSGCENLTGEEGTVFSEEHTTAEYAHIDGGRDNPGYFTLSDIVNSGP